MNRPVLATIALLFTITIFANAQQKIKTHEGVDIGGIKQWIGARSDDDSKPLLLFLHGGPGFSSRSYSKPFTKQLKKDFIVAQWDQRGTGITAAWGSTDDPITIELMHNDTEEVVNYLLRKFNKKKLYLVGFSWGGFLGLHFANAHPELLHAYISVSSMIYGEESERQTLQLIREKAQQSNNTEALAEISSITVPFASWKELYIFKESGRPSSLTIRQQVGNIPNPYSRNGPSSGCLFSQKLRRSIIQKQSRRSNAPFISS